MSIRHALWFARPLASALASALMLTGCAHSKSTPSHDKVAVLADLQKLHPRAEGAGLVVVYRNTSFGGMFGPMAFQGSLFVDEIPAGDIRDDTYNVIELKPGRHSLRVTGSAPIPLQSSIVVNVPVGTTKFVGLDTEQRMTGASVSFREDTTPPLDAIATDCQKGFELYLEPTNTPAPVAPATATVK